MHASTDAPFLFIAGVPNAGTTSLFAYLAAHPRIAPAWIKEPGYFVPPECHLHQPMRFGTTPFETYLKEFAVERARDPEPIRVDGSTLYFTYPGTPERIQAIVPNSRAIVSLREPVTRLESCYKMARFERWIPDTNDVRRVHLRDARLDAGPWWRQLLVRGRPLPRPSAVLA